MDLKSAMQKVGEHLGVDTKNEFTSHEVLLKLYDTLRKDGEIKSETEYGMKHKEGDRFNHLEVTYNGTQVPLAKESWNQRLSIELASDDDGVRTDTSSLDAVKVAIVTANEADRAFVYGTTYSGWSHLSGVNEALMFGAINWKELPPDKGIKFEHTSMQTKEELQKLSYEQVGSIVYNYGGLSRFALIGSWEKELFVRNGFDRGYWRFKREKIPSEFISGRESRSTNVGSLDGILIALDKPETEEQVRSKGLAPRGHQELFYKREIVEYLSSYVVKQIDKLIEEREKEK